MQQPLFIRPKNAKEITGLSLSTIKRLEDAGKFPKRRRVGAGVTGWIYDEVKDCLVQQPERSEV